MRQVKWPSLPPSVHPSGLVDFVRLLHAGAFVLSLRALRLLHQVLLVLAQHQIVFNLK